LKPAGEPERRPSRSREFVLRDLLYRPCPSAIFALADTTTVENGVVILSYRYRQSNKLG
jgi:hypothetical protein